MTRAKDVPIQYAAQAANVFFYRTRLRSARAPNRARQRIMFLTRHATPHKEVEARRAKGEVDHLTRALKALPAAESVGGTISMGSAQYWLSAMLKLSSGQTAFQSRPSFKRNCANTLPLRRSIM